jgi:hypothetical protein
MTGIAGESLVTRWASPVSRVRTYRKWGEMGDTWMNEACGAADGGLHLDGAGGTAGVWPPVPSHPAVAPVRSAMRPPAQRRSGSGADSAVPLRLVQVYLTPVIDEFLRQARSTAIMQGLDVSASAVVRHAMERLMATASPAEMVELLGSPKGRGQHRRGRPRRLGILYTLIYACIIHNSIVRYFSVTPLGLRILLPACYSSLLRARFEGGCVRYRVPAGSPQFFGTNGCPPHQVSSCHFSRTTCGHP